MNSVSSCHAPWWLPGGHTQTIWPLLRGGPLPRYRRERWDTPDGDFIDLDWIDGPAGAPLFVLFHGIEGSSHSHYARILMRAVRAQGWRGVIPHFRGCSGEANRFARAYHSGDSEELDWILRRLQPLAEAAPLYAAGVSLGGNALLKWLGEREHAARNLLAAAVAICPPLDLTIAGSTLDTGFNRRIYTRHLLSTLKPKALAKTLRHPGLFDGARIRRATTLFEFDDAYTSPAHGFGGAADYWRRASARPWLRAIRAPTLLLSALNDPFVPPTALPSARDLSTSVHFDCQREGGHTGFLSGGFPGHPEWLPQRLFAWFITEKHHETA